ncbi:MAG: hypothetical protein IPJ00_05115 [Saprospirales bacterium]|nr:hypothetical protein [Saprospirales bacterium]
MSTYFLVFRKALPNSHGTSKVWIDFKLPNAELFDCIEEEEEMNHLKIQIQSLGESNPNAFEFAQIEIEVMQSFKRK